MNKQHFREVWKVEFEFIQRTEEFIQGVGKWKNVFHISKSPGYNGYSDGECGSRYPAFWLGNEAGALTILAVSCVNGKKELDKSIIIS